MRHLSINYTKYVLVVNPQNSLDLNSFSGMKRYEDMRLFKYIQ